MLRFVLSTARILEELPRFSAAELMAVRQNLMELAADNEDITICNAAAMNGANMLDRMEEEDAGS